MKPDRNAMRLYAVTDRSWLIGESLEEKVEQAIAGGITFLQIREKNIEEEEFIQRAKGLCALAKRKKIPIVVNDNVMVALKSGADGVHIGQEDGDVAQIRHILGEEKILGVSVHTVEEALLAQAQGADYIGVGAVCTTSTKQDAKSVSPDTLKAICRQVRVPVVAIGGINKDTIHQLSGSGIDGVAVVSAIFKEKDTLSATKELTTLVEKVLNIGNVIERNQEA